VTYTQADIDYYHKLVGRRDAEIERKDKLIMELANALGRYIDAQSENGLLTRAKEETE
jgi:hypothetical protein